MGLPEPMSGLLASQNSPAETTFGPVGGIDSLLYEIQFLFACCHCDISESRFSGAHEIWAGRRDSLHHVVFSPPDAMAPATSPFWAAEAELISW
jgi:hypothetical protein